MNKEEEAVIRAIVKEVIKCDRQQRIQDEFYINRRDLYDTHVKVKSLLSKLDSISEVVGKTIVYSFLVGVAGLVIWVLGRIK